jgi:hypothetical protein
MNYVLISNDTFYRVGRGGDREADDLGREKA